MVGCAWDPFAALRTPRSAVPVNERCAVLYLRRRCELLNEGVVRLAAMGPAPLAELPPGHWRRGGEHRPSQLTAPSSNAPERLALRRRAPVAAIGVGVLTR